MVIHGPIQECAEYDIDLGPIMVMDWYHDSYEHIVTEVEAGGVTSPAGVFHPSADSNLVQGKGYFPCANVTNGAACGNAGFATFEFTPGKTHRLRFINTGSSAFETISIDNHTMTVIANDFVPVVPYSTNFITLGCGQRTDVIVEATGEVGQSYWLRAWNDPFCGGGTHGPDGRAVILYPGADTTEVPDTIGLPLPVDSQCRNDPLSETVPVYVIPVEEPETTITITLTASINSTGSAHLVMNGVAFQGDFNEPILQDALNGVTSFNPARNVYPLGDNSTVRIIFINTIPTGHGMHLHGHDFQVLAEGIGTWDGTITNPYNPQRRDVHQAWGDAQDNTTYIVLQYTQDNPGIWPFHCHIAWHVSAGMAIMIEELPDQIPLLKEQMPSNVPDTCYAWDAYTAANIVLDNDSSIKARSLSNEQAKKKRENKITMAMTDEAFIQGLEIERRSVEMGFIS
jgi:FtsP/CotA-like multicopper oxidase with cupredoxin domain